MRIETPLLRKETPSRPGKRVLVTDGSKELLSGQGTGSSDQSRQGRTIHRLQIQLGVWDERKVVEKMPWIGLRMG